MVSIWSAALLRLIYVRACPRPLRNKLCVTTAAVPLLDCWLAFACDGLIVSVTH